MSKLFAVALGNFDGVHLGHQEIIRTCVLLAAHYNIEPIAITFTPHPISVLCPSINHKLIITNADKVDLLRSLGISRVLALNFTSEFAKMSPMEFLSNVIMKEYCPRIVVTGKDFFFGHRRGGSAHTLHRYAQEHNFLYRCINKVSYNYQCVSSSYIKGLLRSGSIDIVNGALGHCYRVCGKIEKGRQYARSLGFATANIRWHRELITPAYGVYIARVIYDNTMIFGLANIGIRPTFMVKNTEQYVLLELHLFNFAADLYDHYLVVELLDFIRPERRFDNQEMLIAQIHNDIKSAVYVINNKLVSQ